MKKSAEKCRFLLNKGGESVNTFTAKFINKFFNDKFFYK